MDGHEAAAAWHLAGGVVSEVTTMVEGVHLGVLSRVRQATGSTVVDTVERRTSRVYRMIRTVAVGTSDVGAAATMAIAPPHRESVGSTTRGATVLAALQAAIGDQVHDDPRTAPLSGSMTYRDANRIVTPAEFAGADPLAVLVHGLAGTEHQWGRTYQDRLAECGVTVAYVRYNSGRPIHRNGAELAELLQSVPGRPRLMLIGHSMGGLVIRSALAQVEDADWVSTVSDVVTLGSPHLGAPLEKVAAVALAGLQRFRESSPIATFGNKRAQGIKDLRFGALLPDHGNGRDPDGVRFDPPAPVELPAGVRHTAVVATIGGPDSVLGWAFGDGLVRRPSAASGGFATHHLHGTGHMRLLDDPRVADILAEVAVA